MKNKAYFLFLLLLPGLTIELFSGSTPPVNYFNLWVIPIFAMTYGCLLVIIRELKVRWQLTWQYLLLMPIVAIYVEGVFMQSFFNPNHTDIEILSQVGVWLNIQWPWTLYMILAHSTLSVALPLFIVDALMPKMKYVPILTKGRSIAIGVMIFIATVIQIFNILFGSEALFENYQLKPIGIIGPFIAIAAIIGLTYLLRHKHIPIIHFSKKRWWESTLAIIYMILFLNFTHTVAPGKGEIIVTLQTTLLILAVTYMLFFVYRQGRTTRHMLPMFNGFTGLYVLFAILQDYGIVGNPDPTQYMAEVGYGFILMMVIVNVRVMTYKPAKEIIGEDR